MDRSTTNLPQPGELAPVPANPSDPLQLPEPIVSQKHRVAVARESLNAISLLLNTLHPACSAPESILPADPSLDQLQASAGKAINTLLKLKALLPQEEIQQSDRVLLSKLFGELASASDFAERVSRHDAYEREQSGLTVAMMLGSLVEISTFVAEQYPKLQMLASKILEPEPENTDFIGQPTQFVPPEQKLKTRELPKESASERVERVLSELAELQVMGPWSRFWERHKKLITLLTAGGLTAGTAVGLHSHPDPTLWGLILAGTAAAGYLVVKRLPRVSRWLERTFDGIVEKRRVQTRQTNTRRPSSAPNLSMPENRLVNLGQQRPKPGTIEAGELSASAARLAEALADCKITEASGEFMQQMGVTALYVTAGQSGEVQRFDTFCIEYDKAHPGEPSLLDTWYPERSVDSKRSDHPEQVAAKVSFRCNAGQQTYPLPVHCQVQSISLYDESETRIEFEDSLTIREGRLGSFIFVVPKGAKRIEYDVIKRDEKIPESEIVRLRNAIPHHPCYVPEQEHFLKENLTQYIPDSKERAKLDYAAWTSAGLTYTMDPFVIALQKRAGRALSESLLGMRMGICDSFAYTCARRMNNLNEPALLIAGLVPEKGPFGARTYDLKEGHAQVVLPTTNGPEVFDATIPAAPDRIDSGHLSWQEKAKALLSVNKGSFRDAYEISDQIGSRLRGDAQPEFIDPHWWDPLYRAWHSELVPAPREASKHDRSEVGHGLTEDYSPNPGLEPLTRALIIKSYDQGFQEALLRSLKERDFNPMYHYLRRPLKVSIASSEAHLLPDELGHYVGYDPIMLAVEYTNTALFEDRLDHAGKEASFEWLFSLFGSPFNPAMRASPDFRAQHEPHLSLDFAAAYGKSTVLGQMSPWQRVNYLSSLLGAVVNRASLLSGVSWSELERGAGHYALFKDCRENSAVFTATCEALINTLELVGEELELLEPDDLMTLVSVTTLLGYAAGEAQSSAPKEFQTEHDYQCDCLRKSLAAILQSFGDWSMPLLYIITYREHYYQGFATLAKSSTTGAFLSDFLTSPDQGLSPSEHLADSYVTRRLSTISPGHDYATDLRRLHNLGFRDFSLSEHADQIENVLTLKARQLWGRDRINLPLQSAPISSLIHQLCDTPGTKLTRLSKELEQYGAVDIERLGGKWPAVEETQVAKRAARMLKIDEQAHLLDANSKRALSSQYLGMYGEYLDILLAPDEAPTLAARFPLQLGNYSRKSPDSAVSALNYDTFAQHVQQYSNNSSIQRKLKREIRLSLSRNLVGPKQLYHGHLFASAWEFEVRRQGDEPTDLLTRFLKECDSGEIPRDETPIAIREVLGSSVPDFRGLPELSDEQKMMSLLFRFACDYDSSTIREHWYRNLPDSLANITRSPHPGLAGSPTDVVWSQLLYNSGNPIALDIKSCLEVADKYFFDHPKIKKIKAPYQRFLQHETGRVFALGNSGDLSHLRLYQQGDDIRRLAHRASARTGKLLIRVSESQEVRNVDLLYDARLIYEHDSSNPGNSSKPAQPNAALTDLFLHVQLAEEQGVEVNLWIPTRGGYLLYEDVTRPRKKDEPPFYRSEEFQNSLKVGLGQYAHLAKEEHEFLGQVVGEQNLLEKVGEHLSPQRILVSRIHPDNRTATFGSLKALSQRGIQIASVNSMAQGTVGT